MFESDSMIVLACICFVLDARDKATTLSDVKLNITDKTMETDPFRAAFCVPASVYYGQKEVYLLVIYNQAFYAPDWKGAVALGKFLTARVTEAICQTLLSNMAKSQESLTVEQKANKQAMIEWLNICHDLQDKYAMDFFKSWTDLQTDKSSERLNDTLTNKMNRYPKVVFVNWNPLHPFCNCLLGISPYKTYGIQSFTEYEMSLPRNNISGVRSVVYGINHCTPNSNLSQPYMEFGALYTVQCDGNAFPNIGIKSTQVIEPFNFDMFIMATIMNDLTHQLKDETIKAAIVKTYSNLQILGGIGFEEVVERAKNRSNQPLNLWKLAIQNQIDQEYKAFRKAKMAEATSDEEKKSVDLFIKESYLCGTSEVQVWESMGWDDKMIKYLFGVYRDRDEMKQNYVNATPLDENGQILGIDPNKVTSVDTRMWKVRNQLRQRKKVFQAQIVDLQKEMKDKEPDEQTISMPGLIEMLDTQEMQEKMAIRDSVVNVLKSRFPREFAAIAKESKESDSVNTGDNGNSSVSDMEDVEEEHIGNEANTNDTSMTEADKKESESNENTNDNSNVESGESDSKMNNSNVESGQSDSHSNAVNPLPSAPSTTPSPQNAESSQSDSKSNNNNDDVDVQSGGRSNSNSSTDSENKPVMRARQAQRQPTRNLAFEDSKTKNMFLFVSKVPTGHRLLTTVAHGNGPRLWSHPQCRDIPHNAIFDKLTNFPKYCISQGLCWQLFDGC